MKHYGDITKISGAAVEPVDVITGGSPCQDLSVAGKRAGLAGERSGLFMEQIRIIKEMREHDIHSGRSNEFVRPRYMVWENVPGAFSSNDGEDFRAVLEETARVVAKDAVIPQPKKWSYSGCIMGDGWSIAWRTHDAQYFGVPQRRRRIALVADFGGSTAPEILFECESVSRDSDQGKSVGQGDPADAKSCVGAAGRCLNSLDASRATAYRKTAHPMRSDQGQGWEETSTNDTLNCHDNGECRTPTIVLENHPADSRIRICADGVFQTLSSRMGTGGNNVPLVMGATVGENAAECMAVDCRHGSEDAICSTLQSTAWKSLNSNNVARVQQIVRRLTPIECERLQGFPDGWTDIGDWVDSKGKKHSGDADSPRYKALGNSIALPFWQWMAQRMATYLPEGATMASLFDGIGGFPLVFSRSGVTPVWASEIEEFPIAVTKIRFKED